MHKTKYIEIQREPSILKCNYQSNRKKPGDNSNTFALLLTLSDFKIYEVPGLLS